MKKLLILTSALLVLPAQAGFVTGFVAGRATSTSSHGTPSPEASSATILSDKYDVITCVQSAQPGRCYNTTMIRRVEDKTSSRGWREEHPTESEYAAALGYKLVHRRGIVIQNGTPWVVMEVSK